MSYLKMSLCTTCWSASGPLLGLEPGFSPITCPSREYLKRAMAPTSAPSAGVQPSVKPLPDDDTGLLVSVG